MEKVNSIDKNIIKEICGFLIIVTVTIIIFFVETSPKKEEAYELRKKELTGHVAGTITKIGSGRKGSTVEYHYKYNIDGQRIEDVYSVFKKIKGISVGSPVGVIYLHEEPYKSRIILTDEDFEWME